MYKKLLLNILILFFMIIIGCNDSDNKIKVLSTGTEKESLYKGKKVLYIDSYHAEYVPSMIMNNTVSHIFGEYGIILKTVYMDAKKFRDVNLLKNRALEIKNLIQNWKPDAVIASDDPANEYVVVPYFKDSHIPFVFIGVNWDVSEYKYPYKNVTGQIEIEFIRELLAQLKKYSRGNRIGIITGDTSTDKKCVDYYEKCLNIRFDEIFFIKDFKDWKKKFIELQDKVDILILRNNSGINNWSQREAKKLIDESTKIPTGTVSVHMTPYVLMSYSKANVEFGEYAANTVLKIFDGISPSEIPITTNKQLKLFLNMKIAKNLKIKFPIELIDRAFLVKDKVGYDEY